MNFKEVHFNLIMFIPIKVLVVFYLLIVTTSKVLGKRNKRPEPVQYVTDREAGGALYPYPWVLSLSVTELLFNLHLC